MWNLCRIMFLHSILFTRRSMADTHLYFSKLFGCWLVNNIFLCTVQKITQNGKMQVSTLVPFTIHCRISCCKIWLTLAITEITILTLQSCERKWITGTYRNRHLSKCTSINNFISKVKSFKNHLILRFIFSLFTFRNFSNVQLLRKLQGNAIAA